MGTAAGPLPGGVISDSPLGWRWCLYVCVPFAAAALVVLRRTLDLPRRRREVHAGLRPDGSGLLTVPMVAGLFLASTRRRWA